MIDLCSFTDEQCLKIENRKRYVKKDRCGPSNVAWEESELLEELDQGEIFVGSQVELEQAGQTFYQFPLRPSNVFLGDPRAQVLGLCL